MIRSAGDGVRALSAELANHGGALAGSLADPEPGVVPGGPGPAQIAAAGPRAIQHSMEYEVLLEMILEGSLLHHGAARVVSPPDADLTLLLGDQLYALGLARLAALGDLAAVAELADLISALAQAHASENQMLVPALWEAAAVGVGWGASPELEAAKALARQGDASAEPALREASRRRRAAEAV